MTKNSRFHITDWLKDDEFLLPEEIAVNKSIEEKVAETQSFIEAKRDEMKSLGEKNAFVRALLTATEDPALPSEQRLSAVVKQLWNTWISRWRTLTKRSKPSLEKRIIG